MSPETQSSKKVFLDVSLRYRSFFDGQCKLDLSHSLLPGLYEDLAVTCLARACTSDYSSLSLVNKRFNTLIKSGILCDLRRTMKILEQFVYLVCDPRGWMAFDSLGKRWMQLPKIPCDECFNHADKESLAVGSELLVFGREFADFAIWKYSLIRRNWVKCDEMNFPRCLFASSTSGSIAVVAGGSNKGGNVLRSAEIYDSSIGKWEMLPNMHVSRRLCSGFFMDDKFYVIGGISGRMSLTCGEELDLKTRKWRRIRDMYPISNGVAQAPPLVAVVNNELYAVEHLKNMVMRYNKEDNDWSVVGRLPLMADSSNGWGLAFKCFGEELLVVGGQRGPEGEAVVLNSWSPDSASDNAELDWKVVGLKEHAGVFVYNCAVMDF